MLNWLLMGAAVVISALGLVWRKRIARKLKAESLPLKRQKRLKTLSTILIVIGAYLFATRVLNLIFGSPAKEEIKVNLFAERVELFGLNLSTTIIYTWIVMVFLVSIAVILRLTVLRHMTVRPGRAQNVLELAVEWVNNYTHSTANNAGDGLASYIFTVAAFLVACAFLELFGLRTPTSDITLTFSLAFITFILINYYGIKKKGLGGRIKSMASPSPAILPIRIITDLALPVSMSARLFGNMLGGMIVMDLIYSALGTNAVGIPSTIGLYFNVFHPLIQAFIFITLTLTFINEATE
ncbi:MAG: FoF1 ATP synthase subunit A [Oscillospiraceae bacterium]|jgi:F-type H+-transporting ATPase subunit a